MLPQTYQPIKSNLIDFPVNLLPIFHEENRIIKPRLRLTPADWADAYVYLPDTSAKSGSRFDTNEVRYTKGILDAAADPLVDEISVMSSAQILKTTMGIIIVCYYTDYDPSPILVLQPTIDAAEKYSKTKFDPMVMKIEPLKNKLGIKSRKRTQTVRYKEGPGFFIIFTGANSPVDLAGHSVKIVLEEDIDRIPPSAGDEGDPTELAEQRTESYSLYGFKHIRLSTPTIKGRSRIHKKYLLGDQRQYWVKCPHCGYKQVLNFFPKTDENGNKYGGLVWNKEVDMFGKTITHFPLTAKYICANPLTRCEINELDKRRMIADPEGQWIPQRKELTRHRSFHLNRLYSPLSTFGKIAKEFIDAKDDPNDLKVFYNTALGLPWAEDETEEIDELGLMRSVETYLTEEEPNIPNEVLLLTCAVDTHPDRVEVSVEGWGMGEENWLIHYEQIWGDIDTQDLRDKLDEFLDKKWTRKDGRVMELGGYLQGRRNFATVIDSGGYQRNTQSIYEYCRTRQFKGIIPIKGRPGAGYPALLNRSKVGKNRDVILQNLGVDSIKETIWKRLNRSVSIDGSKPAGPKTCHFTIEFCDAHYFEMLLAERPFKTLDKRLGTIILWKKLKGNMRNEAWDLKCYNYAAMKMMNPNFEILRDALQKEEKQEPVKTDNRMRSMKVTRKI